jgi:hypothetical protein
MIRKFGRGAFLSAETRAELQQSAPAPAATDARKLLRVSLRSIIIESPVSR